MEVAPAGRPEPPRHARDAGEPQRRAKRPAIDRTLEEFASDLDAAIGIPLQVTLRQWTLPLPLPESRDSWRIAAGTHTSHVWSFTAGTGVGVESMTWGRLRSLCR